MTASRSPFGQVLQLPVDGLELTDQLGRELAAGAAGQVPRTHRGQQRPGLERGQVPFRAAADEFGEQPVQPVEGLRAAAGQLVPPVGQQPQHRQVLVDLQLAKAAGPQRHHDDGVRVVRVALAGMSGVEHPDAGGQLGWHVEDPLAVGEQPRRHRPASAIGALHRPRPARPLPAVPQHRPVAAGIGAEPAGREQHLPLVADLDRGRGLMRIHPDDHAAHTRRSSRRAVADSEDGQRYYEPSRPLLSHASPRCPARPHAMEEPRSPRAGSRKKSVPPSTTPEPGPTRVTLVGNK